MKQNSRWCFFVLFLALWFVAGVSPNNVVIENSSGKKIPVTVEVAETPAARAQGLMFRHQIPGNSGMLFVFSAPSQSPFWMKNTLIPLDMIFIGEDGRVVDVIEQTIPLSEGLLIPKQAYTLVLEVNAGFVKKQSIHIGDRVTGDRVTWPQKGPESKPAIPQ